MKWRCSTVRSILMRSMPFTEPAWVPSKRDPQQSRNNRSPRRRIRVGPADFPAFETNNTAFQATVDSKSAWVSVPALNLNTNTVTMTAWIYPNVDPISAYAAIFYSRRGSADPGGVGIQFTTDNQIGYTW